MIVCLCHRISDRDIQRAAQRGCESFEELQDDTRVATGCGACRDCAEETFLGSARRPGACSGQGMAAALRAGA